MSGGDNNIGTVKGQRMSGGIKILRGLSIGGTNVLQSFVCVCAFCPDHQAVITDDEDGSWTAVTRRSIMGFERHRRRFVGHFGRDVVSVSTSRSRDALTSRLGLISVSAIYVSYPRRYFRPNYAGHINKMSQISSRYL